jgi:hypothetical protein
MEIPKPPKQLYYEYEGSGWEPLGTPSQYFTADDEEILAQPCVVEALSSSYADGHVAGDRARFSRCKIDVARALTSGETGPEHGMDWAALIQEVRKVPAARAAWEAAQTDDALLIRAVAAQLRRVGSEVPSPLAEAEESALLTHPVVAAALARVRESS